MAESAEDSTRSHRRAFADAFLVDKSAVAEGAIKPDANDHVFAIDYGEVKIC